jgi:glycosyltransferase involved in cell wall biosynthesis
MNALPMDAIQRRLDIAASVHPDCATLRDFRAPSGLIEAEREALAHAERWISPHARVLELAGARAAPLAWREPSHSSSPSPAGRCASMPTILFPASALARKGVLELVAALEGLEIRVLLPHGAAESADVWRGIAVERVASIADGIARAHLVVLPAWVEHQPRSLLAAIARGVPVIATAACGLPPSPLWHGVPEGDVVALRRAILEALAKRASGTLSTGLDQARCVAVP